jgi:hypothetical protein
MFFTIELERLAIGIAVSRSIGAALYRTAPGVRLGLALDALGAILSKRGKNGERDEY